MQSNANASRVKRVTKVPSVTTGPAASATNDALTPVATDGTDGTAAIARGTGQTGDRRCLAPAPVVGVGRHAHSPTLQYRIFR